MKSNKIFNEIIKRGGLIGACAKALNTNENMANRFVAECAQSAHSKVAEKLWGTELISSMVKFSKSQAHRNKKMTEFDLDVIRAIKTLRKIKGVKQDILAGALEMTQGNYCKVEKGLLPIAIGQLEIIAKEFDMNIFEILKFAKDGEAIFDSSIR